MALELSVVLPTYNEAENIPVIVERLAGLLAAVEHELIVADDDSPDRTWEVAGRLQAKFPQVRVLRRTGERGLYPAVAEGFDRAGGRFLAVLDADLQHDETLLLAMLERLRAGADLVNASRYAAGGGTRGWGFARRLMSRAATGMAGLVLRRPVSDPMSGFFAVSKSVYARMRPRLRPVGFKILLDLLQNLPEESRVVELPYVFKPREAGESKLGGLVALQFAAVLLQAAWRRLGGGLAGADREKRL